MAEMTQEELFDGAVKVLKDNDRGSFIMPAGDLYPHQWLWDSCFIAIGLRHLDNKRAQTELTSLLRGQWSNGMMPNIIFSKGSQYQRERELWRSYLSPYSPDNVATSGITQPPMLAEATMRIGQKMRMADRRVWYHKMYPHLLKYHEWLYRERDPHGEGLVILLHPYESGMDNSPPWTSELRKHSMSWWVHAARMTRLDNLGKFVRQDLKYIPNSQRVSNTDGLAYWSVIHRLRRKAYNSEALLSRSVFAVEDLAFNCILVRANQILAEIAAAIKEELPGQLVAHMSKTKEALEQLWDETSAQYYSRSFVSYKLVEQSTVATLLPFYAGKVPEDHAKRLLELMHRREFFGAKWPLPSVPTSSPVFDPLRYWQGPTWVNINWLVIEGLKRNGYHKEAFELKKRTLDLVKKSGFHEYFSPLDGSPAGAANFSWTAALVIDMLKSS